MKFLFPDKTQKKKTTFNKMIGMTYFKSTIVIIFTIFIVFFIIISNLISANQKYEMEHIAENINKNFSSLIEKNLALAQTLSQKEELRFLLRDLDKKSHIELLQISFALTTLLDNASFSIPEISDIMIYSNTIQSQNYPSIYPITMLNNSDFSSQFDPKTSVIYDQCSHSRETQNFSDTEKIAIISPVSDYNSNVLGYLCISLSKDYIYNNYVNMPFNDSKAYVVNSDCSIILSDDLSLLGKSIKYGNLSGLFAHQYTSHSLVKHDGKSYLASCIIANKYGHRVLLLTPSSMLNSWKYSMFLSIVISILIMITFIYGISKRLSLKISQPIIQLKNSLQTTSVALEHDIHINEIYDLYHTYNDLLKRNAALMHDIKIKQNEKINAEMNALISQINPHFLYNTLNVISWRALDYNCIDICTTISKLSKLCQYNYQFNAPLCTLRDELVCINLYMDLQKECFNSSFDYTIDIPDEYLDFKLPRFILQPIVENSIIHGLAQKITQGVITITAKADKNLVIRIIDNGTGITPNILRKLNSGTYFSEKYGLANVVERIKLYCGKDYGIYFSSHPYFATEAVITLPIIQIEDEE